MLAVPFQYPFGMLDSHERKLQFFPVGLSFF
jgi:hypothetical protein